MSLLKQIVNKIVFVAGDIFIIAFSFYTGLWLYAYNSEVFYSILPNLNKAIILFFAVFVLLFYAGRLYSTLWRFAGIKDIFKTISLSFCASAISYILIVFLSAISSRLPIKFEPLPYSLFIIVAFLISVITTVERMLIHDILFNSKRKSNVSKLNGKVMLIGAGSAGALLLENIRSNDYMRDMEVVCLIDDDPFKQGMFVNGVKVSGTRRDILSLAKKHSIDTIIFAIPSCPTDEKTAILKICQMTGCKLKTLPTVYQLNSDEDVNAKNVRNIEIDDLLGRKPIQINLDSITNYINDKVVLVTGGGGSIGSELCRQLALRNPKQLIIFDIYENNAYDIQNELKRDYPNLNLVVLIGSVRDSNRINQVFERYRPEIVYHAAAHKHVPLMEDSPNEAIKNNVIGTLKTVRAADKYGTKRFVMISTDKAVNPTNIMGASKRICEMIVQSYNNKSNTEYVAVRFGNVLGSNGSVIPLFKRQIAAGGPVTVTDPNIIRYFMTIPEAVSLVLEAGSAAKGGEIFVLDMGKPVKIIDLAENMIKLSGLTPYVDIDIKFIGLRPGEKMYEELLIGEEGLEKTANDLIYIGKPIIFEEKEFWEQIEKMQEDMYDEDVDFRNLVHKIVPTYQPNENK